MIWFDGSVIDAIAKSKELNAIFVVFVEGKSADEGTIKLNKFLEDERISSKLSAQNFVAIRFKSESPEYWQFCECYKIVPVPSIFFIGQSGTPLYIATDILANVEELLEKINTMLHGTIKSDSSTAHNASLPTSTNSIRIAAGGEDNNKTKLNDGPASSKAPNTTASENLPSVSNVPRTMLQAAELVNVESLEIAADSVTSLENKPKNVAAPVQPLPEASETLRGERKHNDEVKLLQEGLRREKLAELKERERIREQIAGDRREFAQRALPRTDDVNVNANQRAETPTPTQLSGDQTRLQIRFPGGNHQTKIFDAAETFASVRNFIRTELSANSGMREFILATTYPRYEFKAADDVKTLVDLKLVPNAVVLVIPKIGAPAVVRTGGGIYTFMSTLIWAMLTPAVTIWDYFRKLTFIQRRQTPQTAQDMVNAQADAARRRNLDLHLSPPYNEQELKQTQSAQPVRRSAAYRSGGNIHRLRDPSKDDSDDNATYNGNSTQQQ